MVALPTADQVPIDIWNMLLDFEGAPPSAILSYQASALRELLKFSNEHVPYYKGQLTDILSTKSENEFWDCFQGLSIIERTEVQKCSQQFLSSVLPEGFGEVVTSATSGATGTPLLCRSSEFEVITHEALEYFAHTRLGKRLPSLSLCVAKALPHGTFSMDEQVVAPSWGRFAHHFGQHGQCHILNVAVPISKQLEWLAKAQPEYLATLPSNLNGLISEIESEARAAQLPLRQIITHGECVSDQLRGDAQRVLDAKIVDTYSSTEAGLIAAQCSCLDQYHVMAPNVLIEVISDDGGPCGVGKEGRIVVTPLYKYAMPLIRYWTGDYGIAGRACCCGSSWPTLGKIKGRQRNLFRFPDGSRIWPAIDAHGLRQWMQFSSCQIAQIGPLEVEIRATPRSAQNAVVDLNSVTDYVRERLGQPVSVRIKYVERISAYDYAKFEDYVCELDGVNFM